MTGLGCLLGCNVSNAPGPNTITQSRRTILEEATHYGTYVVAGVAGKWLGGKLGGSAADDLVRASDDVVEEGVSGAAGAGGMARRAANTGAFRELGVPMQMRAVKKIAAQGGVGLKGVKVRIVRDPDLVGSGLMGYTHPRGKMIDLYPDAFRSAESLVKTLGHERTHVMQMRIFGTPTTAAELGLNETAAYGIEGIFWNFFKGN